MQAEVLLRGGAVHTMDAARLSLDADALRQTHIALTMVGGRIVFEEA